jgi:hypothetical protein
LIFTIVRNRSRISPFSWRRSLCTPRTPREGPLSGSPGSSGRWGFSCWSGQPACLADETTAQDTLKQNWSKYAAADNFEPTLSGTSWLDLAWILVGAVVIGATAATIFLLGAFMLGLL